MRIIMKIMPIQTFKYKMVLEDGTRKFSDFKR